MALNLVWLSTAQGEEEEEEKRKIGGRLLTVIAKVVQGQRSVSREVRSGQVQGESTLREGERERREDIPESSRRFFNLELLFLLDSQPVETNSGGEGWGG